MGDYISSDITNESSLSQNENKMNNISLIRSGRESSKIHMEDSLMSAEKEFLSVSEFCDCFGFNRCTAYRLIREKKIFALKIGGKYFIPMSKLYDLEYKG